jgi:hypothetical protein
MTNEINEAIEDALDGNPDRLAKIMDRPMFRTPYGEALIMDWYDRAKEMRRKESYQKFVDDILENFWG